MTASPAPSPTPGDQPAPVAAAPAAPPPVASPPPVPPAPAVVSGPAASPAPPAAEPSLGKLVADASEHVSTIVRGEIELAKLELKSSVKNAGVGVGAFAAAAVLLVFALIYFFQAIAETFARYLVPRWVAFFIVFGILVVVAGALAFLGIRKVKRVRAPEKTIATTKETVAYLKNSRG